MRKWVLTVVVVILLAAAGATAGWWLPPFFRFLRVNADLINPLTSVAAALFGLAGVVVALVALKRDRNKGEGEP